MGYVAIKGGEEAIKNSLSFYKEQIESKQNIEATDIENSLKFSVDKVMSEGSLYSKKLSSIAIKKSWGRFIKRCIFFKSP